MSDDCQKNNTLKMLENAFKTTFRTGKPLFPSL